MPSLQGIFLTQGSILHPLHLQHCRWILYPLSHLGSIDKLTHTYFTHFVPFTHFVMGLLEAWQHASTSLLKMWSVDQELCHLPGAYQKHRLSNLMADLLDQNLPFRKIPRDLCVHCRLRSPGLEKDRHNVCLHGARGRQSISEQQQLEVLMREEKTLRALYQGKLTQEISSVSSVQSLSRVRLSATP